MERREEVVRQAKSCWGLLHIIILIGARNVDYFGTTAMRSESLHFTDEDLECFWRLSFITAVTDDVLCCQWHVLHVPSKVNGLVIWFTGNTTDFCENR